MYKNKLLLGIIAIISLLLICILCFCDDEETNLIEEELFLFDIDNQSITPSEDKALDLNPIYTFIEKTYGTAAKKEASKRLAFKIKDIIENVAVESIKRALVKLNVYMDKNSNSSNNEKEPLDINTIIYDYDELKFPDIYNIEIEDSINIEGKEGIINVYFKYIYQLDETEVKNNEEENTEENTEENATTFKNQKLNKVGYYIITFKDYVPKSSLGVDIKIKSGKYYLSSKITNFTIQKDKQIFLGTMNNHIKALLDINYKDANGLDEYKEDPIDISGEIGFEDKYDAEFFENEIRKQPFEKLINCSEQYTEKPQSVNLDGKIYEILYNTTMYCFYIWIYLVI